MEKPKVRIENWSETVFRGENCLHGEVFDHPRIRPGTPVFISLLLSIDKKQNVAETRNSIYILGTPKVEQ